MIKVEIHLFAILREGCFKKEIWELPEGTRVIDVLNRLGIKLEEVVIILVNGMNVELEYILKDGDYISLFSLQLEEVKC